MIYIKSAREAYSKLEINAIGLVCGDQNPTHALSNETNNGALDAFLDTISDNLGVEHWI